MISVENLQEYCRTCWVKLEISDANDTIKAVSTNEHPELQKLMQVCLVKTPEDDVKLRLYSPFLCRCCFEKWLDFLSLYQVAIKTDENIKAVLKKGTLKCNEVNLKFIDEKKDSINECFIHTETLVDTNEVEKYETNYPFYVKNVLNLVSEIKHDEVADQLHIDSEGEGNIEDIMHISKETDKQKGRHILRSRKKKNTTKICTLKIENKSQKKCNNPRLEELQNKNTECNGGKKIRYKCEECNKYFWERKKYDGHRKQIHEGISCPYQCCECNKAYNLYKTLLQHKRECHSGKTEKEFKCEKCNKIFKTGVILRQHINNKHSEQKETLRSICDQCGFIAAHQYSLSRHIINRHTQTDHIKCDYCPKIFKTRYSLKYHVIGNHNPQNLKPFKCSECEMGFSRKTLLNQHKRTHLKYTERIKCDFEGCEVRFVKHGDKTHHMRLVHLKVKQHICDICGEAFGAMQTLRHHRFIHTGEKPYKCNICGQSFRQRTAMKTHRKTHNGKKNESQDVIENLQELNLSSTSCNNI